MWIESVLSCIFLEIRPLFPAISFVAGALSTYWVQKLLKNHDNYIIARSSALMILFRLREKKAYILSIKKELEEKEKLIANKHVNSINLSELFSRFNTERSSLVAKDDEYINIISCRAINEKHKKSEIKIEDTLSHIPILEKKVSNIVATTINIEECKKNAFLESNKDIDFNKKLNGFIVYLKRNIPNWIASIDEANKLLDSVCNDFQSEICVHLKIEKRAYSNELQNIDKLSKR